MQRLTFLILLFVILMAAPARITAQDYSELLKDFDANALTIDDKRFLQTALAFEGYYQGLLDGKWGAISREAMRSYSRVGI